MAKNRTTWRMKKLGMTIVVVYILTYLVPLGVRPLTIPDETRYAEVPREMVTSGDWIVPRLNGVRHFEKPILGYWLNAVFITLLGQNRFAVRLSAALAAGLTALLLFALASRHAVVRRCALPGASILLSSVFFYGVGTFAVVDMPLTLPPPLRLDVRQDFVFAEFGALPLNLGENKEQQRSKRDKS
ncbi:MAG: phospholipid carrier-dependent glycosyltransferase [Victivallales bacterium]|nr:phospholipid carrier-dependent glycosyltransferase [Lentisphaerota bacterium]MBT7304766.1 phospholipid carrier-dependent glycosyltransferase [Victivallales bacterium]